MGWLSRFKKSPEQKQYESQLKKVGYEKRLALLKKQNEEKEAKLKLIREQQRITFLQQQLALQKQKQQTSMMTQQTQLMKQKRLLQEEKKKAQGLGGGMFNQNYDPFGLNLFAPPKPKTPKGKKKK